MPSRAAIALAGALGALLAACGGSSSAIGHTESSCPAAAFALPDFPMVVATVSATPAATEGDYRRLAVGGHVVVAVGPDGARIELLRGAPNDDFAVSLYSHGPAPLETVTVLGAPATLYPAATVASVAGAYEGRIPFATSADRVDDPCSRWELRADEVPDARLAAYAGAMAPAG